MVTIIAYPELENHHIVTTMNYAEDILHGLCEELHLCESANDPYPVDDDEYYQSVMQSGLGLIVPYDGSYYFHSPNIQQALQLIHSEREST